jgi:NAD(P)-dependent dehydrogenase (short-subunit alcohol dehydrogenase family)
VPTDVTRRDELRALFERALAEFGHVDAWVNNAGRGITRPVLQLTDDDLDAMLRVNLYAPLHAMQLVVPHFQERGRGHLINLSSMLGRVPYVATRSAYSAAKHALNALTANLRMELRERWPHIHVSTVSPGVVATEFGLHALGGGFDSRSLPNAQPVEEVAQVLFELIEHPRADVYTRPGMRDRVVRYFAAEDMAAEEAKFPGVRPPAATGGGGAGPS